MSDYFHEQMIGKMKLEVTVPIDNNTTFPVKILTEGKAKEMVLKALEDVLAEIHETGVLDRHSDEIEVALAYGKVETIIEQKIAEVTKNDNRR